MVPKDKLFLSVTGMQNKQALYTLSGITSQSRVIPLQLHIRGLARCLLQPSSPPDKAFYYICLVCVIPSMPYR